MNRRLMIGLAVGCAALMLTGCVNRGKQQQAKRTNEILSDRAKPVALAAVDRDILYETIEITGQIVSSNNSAVGSKIAGKLAAVYVQDGDPVEAGQLIAALDRETLMASLKQASATQSSAHAAVAQAKANAVLQPSKSAANVASAEQQLKAAKAQYAKAKAGAREEERRQAEANVDAAKSNMETAKKNLDRTRELYQEGAISKQRLDEDDNKYRSALAQYQTALEALRLIQNGTRKEDLEVAEAAVRQAEQNLESARASQKLDVVYDEQLLAAQANLRAAEAAVDLARKNLEDAEIRAPFSGKISGMPLQPGTIVSPGMAVARVVGGNDIYFEGQVPGTDVAAINVGNSVEVVIPSLNNRVVSGKVAAVSPQGQEIGRLFGVRVTLDARPADLMPGMFARGNVVLREIQNASVVSNSSIVTRRGNSYLFTVVDGKAKAVQVQTGIRSDGRVQVIGIEPGAQIVVEGQTALEDGSVVKVQEAGEAAADEEPAEAE